MCTDETNLNKGRYTPKYTITHIFICQFQFRLTFAHARNIILSITAYLCIYSKMYPIISIWRRKQAPCARIYNLCVRLREYLPYKKHRNGAARRRIEMSAFGFFFPPPPFPPFTQRAFRISYFTNRAIEQFLVSTKKWNITIFIQKLACRIASSSYSKGSSSRIFAFRFDVRVPARCGCV